jgi:hypothetical protein
MCHLSATSREQMQTVVTMTLNCLSICWPPSPATFHDVFSRNEYTHPPAYLHVRDTGKTPNSTAVPSCMDVVAGGAPGYLGPRGVAMSVFPSPPKNLLSRQHYSLSPPRGHFAWSFHCAVLASTIRQRLWVGVDGSTQERRCSHPCKLTDTLVCLFGTVAFKGTAPSSLPPPLVWCR